jgi:hypothetical protein
MTKAEKLHLSRVAEFGCIVCRNLNYGFSQAEIHHLRYGVGAGQRNNHYNTIPLCPAHHRIGGHGTAIHAGKLAFEAKFGTERELWFQVNGLLKEAA